VGGFALKLFFADASIDTSSDSRAMVSIDPPCTPSSQ